MLRPDWPLPTQCNFREVKRLWLSACQGRRFTNDRLAGLLATDTTDDVAKVGPQLGADVSKTTALETNQASSVAQGIGLGL